MGGIHGLSEIDATNAIYAHKETPKKRYPCPYEHCRRRGVMVQKLNRHIRDVHGKVEEALSNSATLNENERNNNEQNESFSPKHGDIQQPQNPIEESSDNRNGQHQQNDTDKCDQDSEDSFHSANDFADIHFDENHVSDDESYCTEHGELFPEFKSNDEGHQLFVDGHCSEENILDSDNMQRGENPKRALSDEAMLDSFEHCMSSMDGGRHSEKMTSQYRKILERMSATTGGLSAIVHSPSKLTDREGFLTKMLAEKAATTVKVYVWALMAFVRCAMSNRWFEMDLLQALHSRAQNWQRSLARSVKERRQTLRIRDEQDIERYAKSSGETDVSKQARKILNHSGKFESVTAQTYTACRSFLVHLILQNNAQRSGAVTNLTWGEVAKVVTEHDHMLVRSTNKTYASAGPSTLTFSKDEFQMLLTYKALQCEFFGSNPTYVFATLKENPITAGAVSLAVEKMTGTKASATLLRKKTVVTCEQAGSDMSALATHMQHTTQTQQKHYATFHNRTNAVNVYKNLKAVNKAQSLRVHTSKAQWNDEETKIVKNAFHSYILHGGVTRHSIQGIMLQHPEVRELKFTEEQIRSKVRVLHNKFKQGLLEDESGKESEAFETIQAVENE